MKKMEETKKIEIAATASTVAEKTKLGSMVLAVGGYLAKVPKLPIISTGICFASILVETISDMFIINQELSNYDVFDDDWDDDVFDEEDPDGQVGDQEERLQNIADELAEDTVEEVEESAVDEEPVVEE